MRERFPAFITFLVTDLNGASFCHTRPDHPRVVIAHRAYFATVLKTGTFTVGEFSIGISNRLKVIQFALPFYRDDGQMGGVIGGIISSTSSLAAVPKMGPKVVTPIQRVRISQGVTKGLLTYRIEPSYPTVAREVRIHGEVVLTALID